MSAICCVCLTEPTESEKLTGLFNKSGRVWNETGLLEIVEAGTGKKIEKKNSTCAQQVICNLCIHKTSIAWYRKHQKSQKAKENHLIVNPGDAGKNSLPSPLKASVNQKNKKFRPEDKATSDGILPEKDFINSLSHECLAKIFVYLSIKDRLAIEAVCTKWIEAAKSAWFNVKQLDCNKLTHLVRKPGDLVKLLTRCGQYLTILHPPSGLLLDSGVMPIITRHCQNLTELSLHLKNCEENDFVNAFAQMKNLKSIVISFAKFIPIDGPDPDDVGNILKSLPAGIQSISLTGRAEMSSGLEKFTDLRYLKLVQIGLDSEIMSEISQKKTLTELVLVDCDPENEEAVIKENLPNLTKLVLDGKNYTDDFWEEFRMHCNNLSHLSLRNCQISGDYLQGLEDGQDGLKYIDFFNTKTLDNETLVGISNCCYDLEYLDLGHTKVTNPGIKAIITRCDKLEYLNLVKSRADLNTLRHALPETRGRRSGVVLTINVNEKLLIQFKGLKQNKSQFLRVISKDDK